MILIYTIHKRELNINEFREAAKGMQSCMRIATKEILKKTSIPWYRKISARIFVWLITCDYKIKFEPHENHFKLHITFYLVEKHSKMPLIEKMKEVVAHNLKSLYGKN